MPSTPFILKDSQSEFERDSSSPQPPNTASLHSEVEWPRPFFPTPNSTAMNRLQLSLASLSENQLRNMVLRVAAQDPYFCDVIAMELGDAEPYVSDVDDASPTTPTIPKFPTKSRQRRPKHRVTRSRTLSNTFVHFPPNPAGAVESDQEECCYHPGHLETEDYEFLTITAEGQAYRMVQSVSMWSCCEGEDTSSGCAIAPAHTLQLEPTEPRHRLNHAKPRTRSAMRRRRA